MMFLLGSMPHLAVFLDKAPVFVGLVIIAIIVTGMLAFKGPRINQQTVFALVPWMVAGAALFVFADLAEYPDHIKPLLTENGAYLSIYAILGVSWIAMLESSVKPETDHLIPDYLGTLGLGITTILVTFTIVQAGDIPTDRLVYPLVILVGSVAFATIAVFLLGAVYIDILAYASKLSILVVFSHTLDAVSRVVGSSLFESVGHSTLSWWIADLTAITGSTPGSQEFLVSWGLTYIILKVGLTMFLILVLSSHAKEHPTRSSLLIGIVAALGMTSGVTNLLLIATGGTL